MHLTTPSGLTPSDRELWEREYRSLKVIPSTTRRSPSKALLLFSEILDLTSQRRVLDVGCGTGRNSIYLGQKGHQVHSIDFSDAALNALKATAADLTLSRCIHPCKCSLAHNFPYRDGSFDLVIDSYVFCHFIADHLKHHYRNELHRVTRPDGFVFVSLFSPADQYYAQWLSSGPLRDANHLIVTDPHNGIAKQLYTEDQIKCFFMNKFAITYLVNFQFEDVVLDKPYLRSLFALVLRPLQ